MIETTNQWENMINLKIPDKINWAEEFEKIKGIHVCNDGARRRFTCVPDPSSAPFYGIEEWVGGFVRIAVDIQNKPGWGWVVTETFCTQEEYIEKKALIALNQGNS